MDSWHFYPQCLPRRTQWSQKSLANQILDLAKNSISSISIKTLLCKCTSVHWDSCVKHTWIIHNKLSELTVQCKESRNNVWKRIKKGMPAGQLSFLLRAGLDTLPAPLNLWRWRFRPNTKCPSLWYFMAYCPVHTEWMSRISITRKVYPGGMTVP